MMNAAMNHNDAAFRSKVESCIRSSTVTAQDSAAAFRGYALDRDVRVQFLQRWQMEYIGSGVRSSLLPVDSSSFELGPAQSQAVGSMILETVERCQFSASPMLRAISQHVRDNQQAAGPVNAASGGDAADPEPLDDPSWLLHLATQFGLALDPTGPAFSCLVETLTGGRPPGTALPYPPTEREVSESTLRKLGAVRILLPELCSLKTEEFTKHARQLFKPVADYINTLCHQDPRYIYIPVPFSSSEAGRDHRIQIRVSHGKTFDFVTLAFQLDPSAAAAARLNEASENLIAKLEPLEALRVSVERARSVYNAFIGSDGMEEATRAPRSDEVSMAQCYRSRMT